MSQSPASKPESSEKKETPNVLPIPFFQVLEEELDAIRGEKKLLPISWDLEERDLSGNLDKLPKLLVTLAGGEACRASKAMLASALTRLLDGDTIAKALQKSLQGADTWGNIDTLIRVAEDSRTPSNDRQQANRRLLEAAFPEHILSIDARKRSDHYTNLHRLTLEEGAPTALCLSGGGIRSATFGLGVLQGLAQVGAIGKFTYLSTVSGGGYIGGWLSSWIHRSGLASVTKALGGKSGTTVEDPEAAPIRNLRAYSNYLTPRLGFLSADTWTLIATYLRNLLLNWFVFVPLLMAVVSLPRLG